MLSAWLISDHHANFFKSRHDFSPRGNEILMQIHLRHGLMDDTRRSSWHQCSMLLLRVAVSYALLHASIVWFLPDVLVFCVRRLSRRLRQVMQPWGPQQARAKTPGTPADLLLLCSHCKHSRGAEGGSSPWTRKCAQTLLRQGSGRSPSCVHKTVGWRFSFKNKNNLWIYQKVILKMKLLMFKATPCWVTVQNKNGHFQKRSLL